MSIILNDNLDVKAPKPTDARYGPWASTAAALAGVIEANRYIGLTVGVLVGGVVEEYWWNDGITNADFVVKTANASGDFLPLTGGTMTGPIGWVDGTESGSIDIIPDPHSGVGTLFEIGSDNGIQIKSPQVILDTGTLQTTLPGATVNAAVTVAGIDGNGLVSLGYTTLQAPDYSVLDTNDGADITLKAPATTVPSAWVSTGLTVVIGQDLAAETATMQFTGLLNNNTATTGNIEFGARINGADPVGRDIVLGITQNFTQTVSLSIPLLNAYTAGDTFELMARSTNQSSLAFNVYLRNSVDPSTLRIYTTGGASIAGVESVGATAPVVSSGGTTPVISMANSSTTVNGYLSAANFTIFNNKANASGTNATGTWPISITGAAGSASSVAWSGVSGKPTTIAGYGITDAYTKTEANAAFAPISHSHVISDVTGLQTALDAKATSATTLAGYGITNAYTKTESDANYPTKAGVGATGTWGISISGTAASATSASTATVALGVDDLNSTSTIKQWVGLQAEYDALGSWDSNTFYNITDAETPSEPGGGGSVAWDDVTGKPSTFPPSSHVHAISEVTNLQTALDGKADTVHAHAIGDVTGLQTALNAKADDATTLAGYGITDAYTKTASDANYPTKTGTGASGTWPINVTGNAGTASAASSVAWSGVTATPTTISGYGITDAYTKVQSDAAYAPIVHTHVIGDVTGLQTALDGKADDATTLAGYGITNAYTKTESDGLYPLKAGTGATGTWPISITGTAGGVAWTGVTGKPTTIAGYGITDAYTKTEADTRYVNVTGDTLTGGLNWLENAQTATIDIVADPLSSTGDVFTIESDAGTQVKGPYVVLDTTNLQITMPGAIQNAALTVAAIDAYGVVSLGYTQLPPPSYSVSDTTNSPVLIKAAGATVPSPWTALGLGVTLAQDIPVGTGNIQFEGIFTNATPRTGTVEFGLRVNGGTVAARDVVTQIAADFNQTIAMALPMINGYVDGDLLELMARVISNSNDAFQLTMANSDTDLGALRIYTTPSSGGGGTGTVNSVGGVAPIASSGGTDPQISMPAATSSVSGYLSAANFNTFNGKANADGTNASGTWNINISGVAASASAVAWTGVSSKPTTIAGYGITDAYTKTEVDVALAGKATSSTTLSGYGITDAYTKVQADAQFQEPATTLAGYGITDAYTKVQADAQFAEPSTTLAGYGITNAYTKTESDAAYPTKAGAGATGTWNISVSGSAATASQATVALGVDDLNSASTVKQWIGTQAQYDALGTWDAFTYYAITDAETPSLPGDGGSVAWDDVTGKPSTFPPSAHTHSTSEVTGLDTALAGKAATTHTHAIGDVSGLQTALDGKAASSHVHTIANVTGLQTELDGKAAASHTHTTSQITGLDTALTSKAPLADPLFTGNARAPTAAVGTNTTAIATTAFVNAEIANDAPTKTGGGASGTWAIGISGTAALATAVNDNGAGTSMKFWYGTEAEYEAIVTKDSTTMYFRSA